MKRRDLEHALVQLGWFFHKHGGEHDIWTDGHRKLSVPRHREIGEKLARTILKQARS
jgi:mRNA interferase HicA